MSTTFAAGTGRYVGVSLIALGALLALVLLSTDVVSEHMLAVLLASLSLSTKAPHVVYEDDWSQRRDPVTVVTSYYPLSEGSKHSLKEYRTWMANFLPYTRSPIVMYMPPDAELETAVRDLRGDLPLVLHKIPLWELPPIAPLEQDFKTWQHDLDPEKGIHSPALYAIWTAKAWMVAETAKTNAFESKIFFWVDIGSWRGGSFPSWPDPQRVSETFATCAEASVETVRCKDRILLGHPPLHTQDYVQGTFFGGSAAAVTWWADAFYERLHDFIKARKFAGKDQEVMTEVFRTHPDRCLMLCSHRAPFWNRWFFFQPYLAALSDIKSLPPDRRQRGDFVFEGVEAHNSRLVMRGEDFLARLSP